MTADTFVSYVSNVLYLIIFVVTVRETIRRPRAANLDTALLFGLITLIVGVSWLQTFPAGAAMRAWAETSGIWPLLRRGAAQRSRRGCDVQY